MWKKTITFKIKTANILSWDCLETVLRIVVSQTHAIRRLSPVAVSARLAPSHSSYRDPELLRVTGRLMSPDRGFGTSCLLHCGRLTVSANSEDSWKRFCLSRTSLRCRVTLAFSRRRYILLFTYLLTCVTISQLDFWLFTMDDRGITKTT